MCGNTGTPFTLFDRLLGRTSYSIPCLSSPHHCRIMPPQPRQTCPPPHPGHYNIVTTREPAPFLPDLCFACFDPVSPSESKSPAADDPIRKLFPHPVAHQPDSICHQQCYTDLLTALPSTPLNPFIPSTTLPCGWFRLARDQLSEDLHSKILHCHEKYEKKKDPGTLILGEIFSQEIYSTNQWIPMMEKEINEHIEQHTNRSAHPPTHRTATQAKFFRTPKNKAYQLTHRDSHWDDTWNVIYCVKKPTWSSLLSVFNFIDRSNSATQSPITSSQSSLPSSSPLLTFAPTPSFYWRHFIQFAMEPGDCVVIRSSLVHAGPGNSRYAKEDRDTLVFQLEPLDQRPIKPKWNKSMDPAAFEIFEFMNEAQYLSSPTDQTLREAYIKLGEENLRQLLALRLQWSKHQINLRIRRFKRLCIPDH